VGTVLSDLCPHGATQQQGHSEQALRLHSSVTYLECGCWYRRAEEEEEEGVIRRRSSACSEHPPCLAVEEDAQVVLGVRPVPRAAPPVTASASQDGPRCWVPDRITGWYCTQHTMV